MRFKDFLAKLVEVNEAIDGHAAVLMAHTTGNKNNVRNTEHIPAAREYRNIMKDNSREVTHQELSDLLKRHGLHFRSSHPDALKNLHSNLMKVK